MANISSAHGTITLVGDWTEEAIEQFIPVLDCWEFYGEYGIQSYYDTPTVDKPSTGFYGGGRWSFSGTLESFDDWTRDWIKNHDEPLTKEQYDLFLRVMAEQDLSIRIEFNDKEEGFGVDVNEVGEFTSDGESLSYETLSCEQHIPDWKEHGRTDFDSAVDYFLALAPGAEEDQIKKWVRLHVGPSNFFSDFGRYGASIWGDYYANHGEACIEEEDMQNFRDTFQPEGDAWDETVSACAEELGWELDAEARPVEKEDPFWITHADELEVNLEEGTVTYTARGGFGTSITWTNIAEHEELRRRYGWQDTFPFDVPTWKDIKQIAVGQDNVIRVKTDGSAVQAMNSGYFTNFSRYSEKFIAAAAGWDGILLLKPDGTVQDSNFSFGCMDDTLGEWTDIAAIAMGAKHSVGLKADGTVVASGNNDFGQCDVEGWTDVTAIAAGGGLTLGLRRDGTVVRAGVDDFQAVDSWTDIAAVDVGEMFAAALTRDGRVLLAGKYFDSMEPALEWTGITAIAAGGWHILGLKADGTVLSAGGNNKCQCQVRDWTGVASIAAGNSLSFGIRADGTVLCAGGYFNPQEEQYNELPDLSDLSGLELNLGLKSNVVHNGSNGKLEEGMTLVAISLADGPIVTEVDDLKDWEGTDVPIVGMIFRRDTAGSFGRVANWFDVNDCGGISDRIAELEARYGGRCSFADIFEEDNDEGGEQPEGYYDFLQEVLELLLDVELRQEASSAGDEGETEIPHFLDSDGNEYFLGFMVFVLKTELTVTATGPDGEEVELTEDQRIRALLAVQSRMGESDEDGEEENEPEDLVWTEEDEAWYVDWESEDEEPDWPTVELDSLDFKGKRFVLTGEFQNAPDDRDQVKALIEAKGGKCTSSVSGKTDYLVLGDWGDVGARKVEKAQEQQAKGSGIQIISESTLFEFLD